LDQSQLFIFEGVKITLSSIKILWQA